MRHSIKAFPRQNDGFSLVELLVAIVVASIFSAIILTVFITGTKSFQATGIISEIRSEVDTSVGQILNDIRGFDAIRVDQENRVSFYERSLPRLNARTGLLERSTTFTPLRSSMDHSTVEATKYTFIETHIVGSGLTYVSAIEPISDKINIQKTFTLSSPEYVEVEDGANPGRYVIHGILTIEMQMTSIDEEEQQTLTSTIGF